MSVAAVAPALEPVRFSKLKLISKSPLHYLSAVQDETVSMERGTAVHSMLLGGRCVIPYPGKVRAGKEWESFQAANDGCQILTANEYRKARAMAEAVQAHPEAVRLLEGQHEKEIEWSYLGRSCVSHVDVVGDGFITELKTTACADPPRFTVQALRMAYHAQCAFYRQAVLSSGLGKPEQAYVVAVESSAPFAVTVMRLTPRTLDLGDRLCRLWFERLLGCEASGYWPSYAESIVDLEVPEELDLVFETEATPDGSAGVPF